MGAEHANTNEKAHERRIHRARLVSLIAVHCPRHRRSCCCIPRSSRQIPYGSCARQMGSNLHRHRSAHSVAKLALSPIYRLNACQGNEFPHPDSRHCWLSRTACASQRNQYPLAYRRLSEGAGGAMRVVVEFGAVFAISRPPVATVINRGHVLLRIE